MSSASVIRRALLYVPGSSMRFLDKSRSLTVDNVTYDLEDSVTPSQKPVARRNLREFLSQERSTTTKELAVRINSVNSGFALDDLTSVLGVKHLDALVIPKVNSPSDLHFVTDVIRHALPQRHEAGSGNPLRLVALVESARSVMDLNAICKASPYLSGLIFAAEDFALDLSITRTPDLKEFLYARSAVATAARAHDLPSTIDLVTTAFRGEEGQKVLRAESEDGKRLGFNGKQCIHPSQVEVVQAVFTPSPEEVEWAVRVLIADRKADQQGRGAWTFDGKMIDIPVVGKAKALVRKAEFAGMNIQQIKDRWKDQEPE